MKHGKSKLRYWKMGRKVKDFYKKQSHKQERQFRKDETRESKQDTAAES